MIIKKTYNYIAPRYHIWLKTKIISNKKKWRILQKVMLVIYTYTTWWQSSLLLQKLTDKADTTAEKLYSLCDKSINVYFHKGGMFYAECVCLSVCLLAGSCKNYWLHLHKDFTTDVSVDREELLNFGSHLHSASGSGSRIFKKKSSTLQHRAFFHNLAYISGETNRIFMKIFFRDVSLDK